MRLSAICGRIVLFLALAAVVVLTVLAFLRIRKLHSHKARLIALSAFLTLSVQALSYVAYNFGFFLAEPLGLPFFSYGPTLLMVDFALLGLLLSVFRMDGIIRDDTTPDPAAPADFYRPCHRGKIRIIRED